VQAFGGKEMNGVMTYLLAKIIREHSGITYASLLEKLHEDIAKIQRSKHFSGFLKRIFHRRIDQVGVHHTLLDAVSFKEYIYATSMIQEKKRAT
jgi:hypothetical protein